MMTEVTITVFRFELLRRSQKLFIVGSDLRKMFSFPPLNIPLLSMSLMPHKETFLSLA